LVKKVYYGILSSAAHTLERGKVSWVIEDRLKLLRPSSACVDLGELKEWFNHFLFCFQLIHDFTTPSLKITERSREAHLKLGKLLDLLWTQLANKRFKPINFVKCDLLRNSMPNR